MADRSELKHFGVLGMKWGVRKDRIGSRTEGFTIKKGSKIYRTSTKSSEANKGHVFTSIDPKDAMGYARRGSLFGQAAYNMTFKVTKDLVAPDKKTRVDTFIKLLDKDPDFRKALAVSASQYNVFHSPEKIQEIIDGLTTVKQKTNLYQNQLALGVASNKEVRDKYLKELSDLGFNMMIDDADAGIVSRVPAIIFDRGKTLEVVSVNKDTKDFIRALKENT